MPRFWIVRGAAFSDPRGSSTRVALATGFAVVFALWLLWGYQLGRSLKNIEQSVASVHEQYVRGEQTLSKVRTNVLLGSIYLRDALIDTTASRREEYRAELARRRDAIEQSLMAYVPEVASEVEREHWSRLQTELAKFWASRELALNDPLPRTPAQAAALLRTRVVPRRETILEVLDQLAALQDEANRRRQQEANALYTEVRLKLMSMGGVTLRWESAYARGYQIQTSTNGTSWTTVHSDYAGNGGTDAIALDATARYVKMYAFQRATQWGYSLWELEVRGV